MMEHARGGSQLLLVELLELLQLMQMLQLLLLVKGGRCGRRTRLQTHVQG